MNCVSLTNITLPTKLSEIKAGAFYGCGLINITMPAGVKTIASSAFSYCNQLSYVLFMGTEEEWLANNGQNETLQKAFVHYNAVGDEISYLEEGQLYCSICEAVLKPRCDHMNTEILEGIPPTCTEDGLSAGEVCTDCGETLTEQKVISATGHFYAYFTDNGDGTHSTSCYYCSDQRIFEHNFIDTYCECGAIEAIVDENISIGEALSLDSDLTMNFRLDPTRLDGYNPQSIYLEVERDIYGSNGEVTVEKRILWDYVEKEERLIFSYGGIAAAQMNDEIRVTLHIQDWLGRNYVSKTKVTSVASYLNLLLLSMPSGQDKLYTLVMDLLNYGTAAQSYFHRHEDAPVNQAYTRFRNYENYASSELRNPLENLSDQSDNGNASAVISQTLDLGTRIQIVYKVKLPDGMNPEKAELLIANEERVETISLSGSNVDDRGRYIVFYGGNASRDMRRVVYATVLMDGMPISDTYSSYAWTVQESAENLPESLVYLTKMMMFYGDSAAAYFGQ